MGSVLQALVALFTPEAQQSLLDLERSQHAHAQVLYHFLRIAEAFVADLVPDIYPQGFVVSVPII